MDVIEKWLRDYDDNIEKLKENRTILEKEINDVLEQIPGRNIIISSRIKSRNSLEEKMYRNKYFQKYTKSEQLFSFLKDSIGIRMICLEHCDEQSVYEDIVKANDRGLFTKVVFDDTLKNQPESQKNGHDIYRINGKIGDYHFELQIKSTTHMLWGEIEHLLFYKNYTCVIGERYLKQQIEQLHNDIMSIDQRLSSLKQYVLKDSSSKELNEIKDITRSMLYTELTERFKQANDNIEIDLRDMYQAITDFLYRMYNHHENGMKKKGSKKSLYAVFSDINSKIDSKIKEVENWSEFCDDEYEKPTQVTKIISTIIEKIENIIKADVHWSFFMNTLFISNDVSKGELLRLYSHFIYSQLNIREDVLTDIINDEENEEYNRLYDLIEHKMIENIFNEIEKSRKFNLLHLNNCETYRSIIYLFLKIYIYDTSCEISELESHVDILNSFHRIALQFLNSGTVKFRDVKSVIISMNSVLGCTIKTGKYQETYKLSFDELTELLVGEGENDE
ncbi:MAG: hypothetical protein JXR48_16415 [Candidatus Delongbacteria bacterium]|nr:hypothetical protein [Candidatus Delongbacteria bacterium]